MIFRMNGRVRGLMIVYLGITVCIAQFEALAAQEVLRIQCGTPSVEETIVIHSEILGETRHIYVQLPEGYSMSDERYPVLFVMDGEWLYHLASSTARYYSYDDVTDESIPRMLVVGVENTDRDRDYAPTTKSGIQEEFPTAGQADRFLSFLERELVPLIEARYRAVPFRAVAGWSFSGLFSAYSAVAKPDLFQRHLCISPAIWWDHDMVYDLMQKAEFENPKRMVFTLGAGEAGGYVYRSTKRLLEQLKNAPKANLTLAHFEFEGVGHSWGVAAAMDKGLQSLFFDYLAPDSVVTGGIESLHEYYRKLSHEWRYGVVPPAKLYISLGSTLASNGNLEGAINVLEEGVKVDPNNAWSYYCFGGMLRKAGQRDRALSVFQRGLELEFRKSVPNGVNLRAFRTAIARLQEK